MDDYSWKRLRIMASEDVGPAEPDLPATIEALYRTHSDLKKKKDEAHAPQRLQLVHAGILLAQLNRIVDHALIHHFTNHAKLKQPFPISPWTSTQRPASDFGRATNISSPKGSSWRTKTAQSPYRELAQADPHGWGGHDRAAEAADLFT